MNRPLHLLFLFASISGTSLVSAQIAFGGRAFGLMEHGPALSPAPLVRMPVVDVEALMAEDAARQAQGLKGPHRFGYNHATDLSSATHGVWDELQDGDGLWRLNIECPEAVSINFVFSEFVVPGGGLVFVYNDEGHQLGAFTANSRPGHTRLGVTQLRGERITVEYFEPAAVRGQGSLRIGRVTHAYRDVLKRSRDFGDSGDCNVNVICPEGDDWRDEIRAVALITVGGSGFCTGTLLNNCEEDGMPYFLTADHCLDADVEDWVFRFNWDSPTCTPTSDAPMDQTVSGCQVLVNSTGTDMALLLLDTPPPSAYDVFYSGWYKGSDAATSVVGIHHPQGDIKKISRSDQPVIQGTFSGADCWHVQAWNLGTTEEGSSGSGLWNQDNLLVGQLYGGEADCSLNFNDYYGRLDMSWPFLEPYLGNCGDQLTGSNDPGPVGPITTDVAVTSITNIQPIVCGSNLISPRITLKNNGTQVVTTITVDYGVAGQPTYTSVWTGSLQPGQTFNHNLPTIAVPGGSQTLTATSSAPNGLQDQVAANNSWSLSFVVSFPAGMVNLQLRPDNFGTEITWVLTLDDGTPMYQGGPYNNGMAGQTINVPFCLSNNCYYFTIYDLFGDGICCAHGNGNYALLDMEGTVLAESDGQYGLEQTKYFCPTAVAVPELTSFDGLQVFPNPTSGFLQVQRTGTLGTVRISLVDGIGRTVIQEQLPADQLRTTLDLGGQVSGLYLLVAEHANGRVVQRIVVQR